MIRRIDAIGVGVPARDEEQRIGACIRSVAAAATFAAVADVPIVVVVAADDCTDRTVAVVEAEMAVLAALAPSGDRIRWRVLECAHGRAGAARATAIDAALVELGTDPATTWLATTDADTTVAPGWLAAHRAWASRGYDGVAGLVGVDWEGTAPGAPALFLASVAPLGLGLGHEHVHGANLGLLAGRWLEVGGCGDGRHGEDHELWRRLRAVGAAVIGVDDLEVVTSSRLQARAPLGFSHHLASIGVRAEAS